MSEHTPGPWQIGPKLHGFDYSVVNPKGDAELGNWLVAGARWEANARLIAAAPDLLALLKDAVSNREDAKPGDHHEWRQRALSAIAKAEAAQ